MSRSSLSSGAKALGAYSAPVRPKGGGAAMRLSKQVLSAQSLAEISRVREAMWRPGLADQPLHSEVFASTRDASGAGLALALAGDALGVLAERRLSDPISDVQDRRCVLWVQDARSIQLSGRPYLYGLPEQLQDRLIHVAAKTPEDTLFALEEGLRCRDLACVIGEIVGNPRTLDFTASRRLSLAAHKHGTPLWLVRLDAASDLSSARMRWRVKTAPSAPSQWNTAAPGAPQWQAELFRARSHAPGHWIISHDTNKLVARRPSSSGNSIANSATAPDTGNLVCPTFGRSLAAVARM